MGIVEDYSTECETAYNWTSRTIGHMVASGEGGAERRGGGGSSV